MASTHPALSEFTMWPKNRLKPFLKARGLPVTGTVHELRALAFAANVMSVPLVKTPQEEKQERCSDYRSLLTLPSGVTLPDPCSALTTGWIREQQGVHLWPPTMYSDMAEYLVDRQERSLLRRLMGDYKDGKGFSYFDSGFIGEILYHPVNAQSTMCFLKSESARSQRKNDENHKVWISIEKKSGRIGSAYCSCFAGLGSTCNHVAGVLFKLDHAWQNGMTNKACTSKPAEWTRPAGKSSGPEMLKVRDMDWKKPNWSKGNKKKHVDTATKRLFHPVVKSKEPSPSLEELMSALYLSSKDSCVMQYALPRTAPSYEPEDDVNVEQEVEIVTSPSIPVPIPELVRESTNLPTFTKEQVGALAETTKYQNANPFWSQQRVGRITASIARSVLVRAQKISRGIVDFSPHLVDCILGKKTVSADLPALKYGHRMEPVARQAYIQHMQSTGHKQITVTETGLIVKDDAVFIGASPDGLVQCECCDPPNGLLEIKCPLSISHSSPVVTPPTYLKQIDGRLTLCASHTYYSQVQFQLMVTNRTWCDFFVYTGHGYHCERIKSDAHLQTQLFEAAAMVFKKQVLPAMTKTSPAIEDTAQVSTEEITEGAALADDSSEPSPPPPAKRRRTVPQRTRKAPPCAGPVYLCGICQSVCLDDFEHEADSSVGCDRCFQWYHWGCVGFEEENASEAWYCTQCASDMR